MPRNGRLNRLIHSHQKRWQISNLIWKNSPLRKEEKRLITQAALLATIEHRHKRRRNGEPIIFHERALFIIAFKYVKTCDWEFLVACFLHDLVEDYPNEWSYERIAALYNWDVARLVQAVTKPPRRKFHDERSYNEAIFKRVRRGGLRAKQLKIVDRYHNMITLYGKRERQVNKIIQTINYILPMAREIDFLFDELLEETRQQMVRFEMDTTRLTELN